MDKPKNIKRLVISSKEIAELVGAPINARIVDLTQEVTVQMFSIGDDDPRKHTAHLYGDTITLEWE